MAKCRTVSNMFSNLRNDERGAVIVIFALALPVLLAFGAIGVDVSRAYLIKAKLQAAADAAALAGVQALANDEDPEGGFKYGCDEYDDDPQNKAACQEAIRYAQANMSGRHGEVLLDDDVIVGCYNSSEREVNPIGQNGCAEAGTDAVEVVTERAENRADPTEDNPLNLFLAPASVIGEEIFNVRTKAAAAIVSGKSLVPCMTARSGEFRIGGSTYMNLPNCGIRAKQKLNRIGNAADVTLGGVAYREYDGQKGNSTPKDDFNGGTSQELAVEELSGTHDPDTPEAPSGATPVSDVCDVKKGKVKGTCDLRQDDAYVIDSDMEFTGNTQLLFRQSNQGQAPKPSKLFVNGEFKIRNTQVTGCFQLVADSIDINGNPFVSGACRDFDPANGSSSQSIRLVY